MSKIILLSGGMDSLISWRVFHRDAMPVFLKLNTCYIDDDLKVAESMVKRLSGGTESLNVLEGPTVLEDPDGHVANRNALILSYMAHVYRPDEIVVSAPRGEFVFDQQPAFYRAMARALQVDILNPLHGRTKTQALALYLKLYGYDTSLHESRSCYTPGTHRCGVCPACVKRWIAMRNTGTYEEYDKDPWFTARDIFERSSWLERLGYGIRPTWEAWRAMG